MSKKYALEPRAPFTAGRIYEPRQSNYLALKENRGADRSFKIDSYKVEPSKEADFFASKLNTGSYKKDSSFVSNENDVMRKLQTLKLQLQSIPGWENVAKTILFGGSNQPLGSIQNRGHKTSQKGFEQNINSSVVFHEGDSSLLESSNVSFKIRYTDSIQGSSKTRNRDFQHETSPLNRIKQFSIDKSRPNLNYQNAEGPKDIDKKISEIQRKIKESELQKRRLGVQFTPFQRKTSHSKHESQEFKLRTCDSAAQKIRRSSNYSRPPRQPERSFRETNPLKKKQQIDRSCEMISPRFAVLNDRLQSKEDYLKQRAPKSTSNFGSKPYVNAKMNSSYIEPESADRLHHNLSHDLQTYSKSISLTTQFNNRHYANEASRSYQPNKVKTYEYEQTKTKNQIKRLVKLLVEQVRLDESFRNFRLWLKAQRSEGKLQKVKSLIDKEGFNVSLDKLEKCLSVNQKEDNPFYSVTSQSGDYDQVAHSFVESQRHWQKQISKRLSRKQLERQGLKESIDLEKKGFIALQDLVRFLNMETGTFFRNRDLYGIFSRLCPKEDKIGHGELMDVFCC